LFLGGGRASTHEADQEAISYESVPQINANECLEKKPFCAQLAKTCLVTLLGSKEIDHAGSTQRVSR
jgi:hypothetical protein